MEYVLGAFVSLLIQWLKGSYNLGGVKTLLVLAVVSLVGAVGYTWLVHAGYWSTVANVIMTAGAFYTFILQRFENKEN